MSETKKCDRCGKLYEEYNVENDEKNANGIAFKNIDKTGDAYGHGNHDLCPDCMTELRTWFDDPAAKLDFSITMKPLSQEETEKLSAD